MPAGAWPKRRPIAAAILSASAHISLRSTGLITRFVPMVNKLKRMADCCAASIA
jgi:hypothetical protein